MQDKRTDILMIIQKQFPDCEIRILSSVVQIKRGSVILNFGRPIIIEELEYYYNTNQLEKHLKELQS